MRPPSTVVSQRTRILVMLQQAGENGVTNFELADHFMRFSARIHELRDKYHYDIKTIRESEQKFRFVLHQRGDLQPITAASDARPACRGEGQKSASLSEAREASGLGRTEIQNAPKFVLSSPQPNRSVGECIRDMTPPTERASLDYRHQCELEFRSGCGDE